MPPPPLLTAEKSKTMFRCQRAVINGSPSQCVRLNVGGSLYVTTIHTLTKHDSKLSAMFSGWMEVPIDSEVSLDGTPLPLVSTLRILGLFLQSNGKHTTLITRLTNTEDKVNSLIRQAYKSAVSLPTSTSTARLLSMGVHNSLTELTEAHRTVQLLRLSRTRPEKKKNLLATRRPRFLSLSPKNLRILNSCSCHDPHRGMAEPKRGGFAGSGRKSTSSATSSASSKSSSVKPKGIVGRKQPRKYTASSTTGEASANPRSVSVVPEAPLGTSAEPDPQQPQPITIKSVTIKDQEIKENAAEPPQAHFHGKTTVVLVFVVTLLLIIVGMLVQYLVSWDPAPKYISICRTEDCAAFGRELKAAIDPAIDPCHDFHGFVCGGWKDSGHRLTTEARMIVDAYDMAITEVKSDLRRASKVTQFFRSCMRAKTDKKENLRMFAEFRRHLGLSWPETAELLTIEQAIVGAKLSFLYDAPQQDWFELRALDEKTPSLPAGIWLNVLRKHDRQFHWRNNDTVITEDVKIFQSIDKLSKTYGEDKLITGLSWIFIQTHLWAVNGEPSLRFNGTRADLQTFWERGCMAYVESRLGLLTLSKAINEHYGKSENRLAIYSNLRRINENAKRLVNNLTWMDESSKRVAFHKLDNMTRVILPSDSYFDKTKFKELYTVFPKLASKVFMTNLINTSEIYRQLRNHEHYADVYSFRVFPRFGREFYLHLTNTMTLAMGVLNLPLFYNNATLAIRYGGMLSFAARQMAKSLDEVGVTVNDAGHRGLWLSPTAAAVHAQKARCDVGASSNTSRWRQLHLFPVVAGMELAFESYAAAVAVDYLGVDDYRIVHLESFSDEQVFFLAYCYGLCAHRPQTMGDECNVPAKNSPHFAAAYRCPMGSPMNPPNKCTFFTCVHDVPTIRSNRERL
ncbi:hypothetical protein HPB49_005124 [Dermacentor silvarum]|uniref:Uncharacterized protein n=1 Tax=Dermacentor silvarum TaxID=543639 RepID=A0ACB8CDJ3_DERSI|nr:hypothetical protein HPB49_005124 [Dermacentor silvarum]